MSGLPLVVLVIEDESGQAIPVRRKMRRAEVVEEAGGWAKNDQETLDYVHREGKYLGYDYNGHPVTLLNVGMPKRA